ncbi:MAG: acetyl-CoA C-acetyltransferase [Actinomycetota bacterium]
MTAAPDPARTAYIVAGARTPIGKLSGGLAPFSAAELGGKAITAALERAGVGPDQVDFVFMGHVLQAGAGQITARQAAAAAGIPMSTPSTTVNKVCLSGLNTIQLATMMIQTGQAEIVVAGGMESMTNAPYLLPGARAGYRAGDKTVVDSMMYDGLFCAFDACSMGEGTENYTAERTTIDRAAMDRFAALSHERSAAAHKEGRLDAELIPVEVPQRRGDPVMVEADEGVRPGTTAETLASLRPAFTESGSVTAGNASQISDGASAVVMMSRAKAEELGVESLGEVVSYGEVAGDPSLLTKPSEAARVALAKAPGGLSVADIDLFEINEAFAAVVLASMDDLGIDDEIVNVNGGGLAMGHPIGASGNRLALTLLHELRRRGQSYGVACLCGGGGQGDALVVKAY